MEKHEHVHHARHQSQHTEEWKNRSIVFTAILALFIAIASFGAENANHHSILEKDEASNQWAFFQAKALKERLYELETRSLTFTQNSDTFFDEKAHLVQTLKEDIERYKQEQADIQYAAQKATKKSAYYDKKGNYYELARVFFELGIVLSAVFLLSTRLELFWGSVGSGALGLLLLIIALFF